MKTYLGLLLLALACAPALARQPVAGAKSRQKLPSAAKVVADFVKAVGGKKRLAANRDATYEWVAAGASGEAGTATTHLRAPSSFHFEARWGGRDFGEGVTPRAAWARGPDGIVRTLTDAAAKSARMRAALDAGRLADYKKQNLAAVTVGAEEMAGEGAYPVEFRSREGARSRYLFSAATKLLIAKQDETGRTPNSMGRSLCHDWRG